MSGKPIISGILALAAVAVGVASFATNWIEFFAAHAFAGGITGFELLKAPFDNGTAGWAAILTVIGLAGTVVTSIGLAGTVVTSILCFLKEGEDTRIFLFLCFFAVFFAWVLLYGEIDGDYSYGTGMSAGPGFWMLFISSIMIFVAMLLPDVRRGR